MTTDKNPPGREDFFCGYTAPFNIVYKSYGDMC
jgi:hypothetical protein